MEGARWTCGVGKASPREAATLTHHRVCVLSFPYLSLWILVVRCKCPRLQILIPGAYPQSSGGGDHGQGKSGGKSRSLSSLWESMYKPLRFLVLVPTVGCLSALRTPAPGFPGSDREGSLGLGS